MQGIFCANFAYCQNGSNLCWSMWCRSCYTSDEELLFHVGQDPILAQEGSMDYLVDADHLGNVLRALPPDALAFHYARDGEHFMVSL
jgi:hypothetical protein